MIDALAEKIDEAVRRAYSRDVFSYESGPIKISGDDELLVRFANRSDARALRRIRLESFIKHYGAAFMPLYKQEITKPLFYWEQAAIPTRDHCFVITLNKKGEIVGIMGAKRFDKSSLKGLHSNKAEILPIRRGTTINNTPRHTCLQRRRPGNKGAIAASCQMGERSRANRSAARALRRIRSTKAEIFPVRRKITRHLDRPARKRALRDRRGVQPVRPGMALFYGTYFQRRYRGNKGAIAASYQMRERFIDKFRYEAVLFFIRPQDTDSSQNHLAWGAKLLGRERLCLTAYPHTRLTLWDWFSRRSLRIAATEDAFLQPDQLRERDTTRIVRRMDTGSSFQPKQ